jgi:hypothetical protein
MNIKESLKQRYLAAYYVYMNQVKDAEEEAQKAADIAYNQVFKAISHKEAHQIYVDAYNKYEVEPIK